MKRVTVLLTILTVACGSYSERSYRGDGTLRDHGWYSGSGRYTLDLGDVDLGTRGERRFSLAHLPPERLALGLGFRATPPTGAELHVKLQGADGTLIEEAGVLGNWLRSGSRGFDTFLYCKGAGERWSEMPGTAWGCVFKPKAGEAYNLLLEVVRPADEGAVARLIVEGGPPDFLP